MRGLSIAALVLVIIGALNWGLVGLLGFNLVTFLFGESILARIIYVLVGVAGLHGIVMLARLSSKHDNVCVPDQGHLRQAPQA